ncbi:ChiQ/YbfN family lipoprotein [Cedecea colo]|uniref:Lipoprotein n=1 Tax=Cedecea colo TaxID=2552946 RepID=A0ABX0VK01_9ENTR|nr:hypothetical protein [Cedecea colo]
MPDEKIILLFIIALGLTACAQPTSAPEDSKLNEAYSACINTAEGNPDKIQACQRVLNILAQEKQHQEFAKKETVRTLDYQNCIQATRTGNDRAAKAQCDKIWQEIRVSNR